ncbi:MAG: ABC transporter ATP-binding protein, partial [Cryomorphaceae bacterium]|nr:ABC transporter ATP-binding protein [Cryomorphaceae bacterium]
MNLFEIKKVFCQYPKSDSPVLFIDEMSIQRGEIVFFVGESGVGKSTVLETLGLMNNTLVHDDGSSFKFFERENKTIDFFQLWKKNKSSLSDFRKRHLSFIFQETNLFNNLSAYDNVLISQLLQGQEVFKAKELVNSYLNMIFKEETVNEIVAGKEIQKLSGGQRQRLAFLRAVSVNFSVLFADEPTGNLDINNANKLIQFLVNQCRNENKTVVIVTHDITLAAKYGTKIFCIEKENVNGKQMGVINVSNCFLKKENNELW